MEELLELEVELERILADDDLYWVRNDAKFRAVAQTRTYEEFQNFVKAAHLKPIDQKDRRDLSAAGAPGVARWNPLHGNAAAVVPKTAAATTGTATEQKPPEKKPASFKEGKTTKRSYSTAATDFFKRWRLCRDPLERSRLLLEHSPRLSKMLEGREAPGEVAAEVPMAVAAALDSSGAVLMALKNMVLDALEAFANCKRFELTATMYVGQKEAECLETALQKLIDITEDDKEREKVEERAWRIKEAWILN